MALRNIGRPRGAEAGVCVVSLRVSFHISRNTLCLWVQGKKKRRALVPHRLINDWIAVEPCCTVASVCKRLQASGIERSRRSVQNYVSAEH